MKVANFMHEMATTSSVFGRESGVHVTFEGTQAFTDGQRINLPALPLDAELTPELVQMMRGYVDHEAGHLRESDMPVVMGFYDKLKKANRPDLKALHNSIEDIFMEKKVTENYRGSYKNLYTMAEDLKGRELERVEEYHEQAGHKPFIPELVGCYLRAGSQEYRRTGNNHDKVYNMMSEEQKAWVDRWLEDIDKCETSEDTIRLAKSIYKKIKEDEENSSDSESPGEPQGDPQNFDPTDGDDIDLTPQDGEPKGGEGEESELGLPELSDMMSEKSENGDEKSIYEEQLGPKLGGKYRIYTTKNDTVYKKGSYEGNATLVKIVNNEDTRNYENIKANLSATIRVLRAKFRRLLLARVNRHFDCGRIEGVLDTKRLAASTMGAENVFKKRVETPDEDTAIYVLVDLSTSMSGMKAETAQESAIAMAECFEGTQFRTKFVGFCNKFEYPGTDVNERYHRYERTNTVVFKDFNQPLRKARGPMGRIEQAVGGNNSDYDFIVAALAELEKRPEKRKILITLSDGAPACHSDAPTMEHIELCKEAIEDASRKGVECLGIGIEDHSASEIYPNSVTIRNTSQLPKAVFKKLKEII